MLARPGGPDNGTDIDGWPVPSTPNEYDVAPGTTFFDADTDVIVRFLCCDTHGDAFVLALLAD
jgi:hypothetical protein